MKYLKLFEKFQGKNIDLSIELEKKYREGDSFDEDDFLKELGVADDEMFSMTFWTALELGRDKYRDMSDEEFQKEYDKYKNL